MCTGHFSCHLGGVVSRGGVCLGVVCLVVSAQGGCLPRAVSTQGVYTPHSLHAGIHTLPPWTEWQTGVKTFLNFLKLVQLVQLFLTCFPQKLYKNDPLLWVLRIKEKLECSISYMHHWRNVVLILSSGFYFGTYIYKFTYCHWKVFLKNHVPLNAPNWYWWVSSHKKR